MRPRSHGFSLIEVVLAIGLFALGIGTVLGLLPGLLHEHEAAQATQTALGLPDGISVELQRIAAGDLAQIEGRLANFGSDTSETLRLVADRDGVNLRAYSPEDTGDQYFVVELFRFSAGTPLAFNSGATFLAVHAKVSWPFKARTAGGLVEVASTQRDDVRFNLVLNR